MDTPGIRQLWQVREAEAKLKVARQQRLAQLSQAKEFENTVRKEQARHQTLLEEARIAPNLAKGMEADRAAASVALAAAQASLAYSEVVRLAAIEMRQANAMLEAQISMARDSLGWVDLVKSIR